MKNLALIFALFLLCKPMIPLLNYGLHYERYAQELCENKEDVERKCNGKCQLAKEMTEASDLDGLADSTKKDKQEQELVFYTLSEILDFDFSTFISSNRINARYLAQNARVSYELHDPPPRF